MYKVIPHTIESDERSALLKQGFEATLVRVDFDGEEEFVAYFHNSEEAELVAGLLNATAAVDLVRVGEVS